MLEYQEFIQSIQLTPRNYSIEINGNYVVIGPRRAGKTYFLYQIIKDYLKEGKKIQDVIFMNFEDERLLEFDRNDFDNIIQAYNELFEKKPICFFDEIHVVNGWENFVRRLADTGYRVFVTGSNAKMLSKDIASTLGGRFLAKEILPLSFKEYLLFNGRDFHPNDLYSSKLASIKRIFYKYFTAGAYPETLSFTHTTDYLSNLYKNLLYGDILMRFGLRNETALKLIVKKIAESIGDESSYRRITNLISATGAKISTSTVIDYIGHLQESYFIFGISNYVNKFSERESKKKYYFIDNGLLNLFLLENGAFLLENLVFIELFRRFNSLIFYFKKKYEVDFFIPEKKTLIQVSYSIQHPETLNREIRSILDAQKELEVDKALIITYDEERIIIKNDLEIKVIPIWKWLLVDDISS